MSLFKNREGAGEKLAESIERNSIEADIVLAIPRGGLPVGRVLADKLDLPLDIMVASKMGAPDNPELGIGAVSSEGYIWKNEGLINRLNVSDRYLEEEQEEKAKKSERKASRYREEGEPELSGKKVIITDDGVATGSTIRSCIKQVLSSGIDSLILAIPVGPQSTISELEKEADEVVCLEKPSNFQAVGQFYEDFEQVTDEEAISYLRT